MKTFSVGFIEAEEKRFCTNDLPETQEHLEICDGTKFERRGVRVSEVMGIVIFWRRMKQKTPASLLEMPWLSIWLFQPIHVRF